MNRVPPLIDSHCHLSIPGFIEQIDTIIKRAERVGVHGFVLPGVDRDGWRELLRLCRERSNVYPAPGLHPLYIERHTPEHLDELEELARNEALTAIGEIGLDFFHPKNNRPAQIELFERQLQIAKRAHLPLLLHVRKAHDQVLSLLRKRHFPCGGIVHAFSGSLQQAHQYIDRGFGIGVCGNISYDRARKIRNIVTELDRDWLVLETDSPDLPLASHRGEPNRPEYLPEVLQCLADLRGEDPELLGSVTSANTRRLLKLDAGSF